MNSNSNTAENQNYRSSHRRCSVKKAVLKNFIVLTVKQLRYSLFLVQCRFQHSCFLVNTANFKNSFFEKHLRKAAF